jgi:hypothetical protein
MFNRLCGRSFADSCGEKFDIDSAYWFSEHGRMTRAAVETPGRARNRKALVVKGQAA